jgi:glyoxylase-like metal-dependent hydrolase (beta-lactamase superfamily II)
MNHAATGGSDAPLAMGYYFWILSDGENLMAVDCAFSAEEALRRARPYESKPSELLAQAEIDPAQVGYLILTHLHYDHAGNIDLFPNARVFVNESEIDFWYSEVAARPQFGFLSEEKSLAQLREALAQGRVETFADTEQVCGVTLERVGGHSPGLSIVHVPTTGGTVVLASDAAHFSEQIGLDALFNFTSNVPESYRALDRLGQLEEDGEVLCVVHGHDGELPPSFEALPGSSGDLLRVLGPWPRKR